MAGTTSVYPIDPAQPTYEANKTQKKLRVLIVIGLLHQLIKICPFRFAWLDPIPSHNDRHGLHDRRGCDWRTRNDWTHNDWPTRRSKESLVSNDSESSPSETQEAAFETDFGDEMDATNFNAASIPYDISDLFSFYHDESTYKSGEISAKRWIMNNNASFYNKGRGRSVMCSDFLVMHKSGLFFSLNDKEFETVLAAYPELKDNFDINYEKNSASASINVGG
ncbi:unnamed protein product [Didymodactylos carnosus]|uniref:Uncharacterized protein n=1 Tax=Didymodactylos carnosus TaxID=1234261 RepID=A0A814BQT5_9BILA|nr:unnamed protein product [Didymodactylos carnosus]CAF1032920.1 unnamed protein product [Didymodactylos carnosus]CAF3709862.1 unnamed protein product [Didymodactylos carnosus]CAF3801213.1 unnamed protein product [Didymodactylos carnosus]